MLTATSAGADASTGPDVIITEIADPYNEYRARYVKLLSVAGQSLEGLRLVRWTNGDQYYSALQRWISPTLLSMLAS